MPSAGTAISAEAPPDSSTSSARAGAELRAPARARARPARSLPARRHRVAAAIDFEAGGTGVDVDGAMTRPARTRVPSSARRRGHRRRRLAGGDRRGAAVRVGSAAER